MKKIGITQRVENISSYNERRDCLDQRFTGLLQSLGFMVIPLPNTADTGSLTKYIQLLDAVLFSGGNSLSYLDPQQPNAAPERDQTELILMELAIKHELPVVGVCRGMQMINHYFAGDLQKVSGHVATYHDLVSLTTDFALPTRVNSYHDWAIPNNGSAAELVPIAVDNDNNVEAFQHKTKPILGIMWHPEREQTPSPLDIQLLKRFIL